MLSCKLLYFNYYIKHFCIILIQQHVLTVRDLGPFSCMHIKSDCYTLQYHFLPVCEVLALFKESALSGHVFFYFFFCVSSSSLWKQAQRLLLLDQKC